MLSARQCRNEWRWDDNVRMGGRPRMMAVDCKMCDTSEAPEH